MAYEVIKTISGRQYRYLQETYRESGRVRTRNTYLGPVDGGVRRRGCVTGLLQGLVRKKDRNDFGETETQARERVAREDRERVEQARVNELLTGSTISLGAINEIAEGQTVCGKADVGSAQAGVQITLIGERNDLDVRRVFDLLFQGCRSVSAF